MLSAMQNPGVVREYLKAKHETGRVLGPVLPMVASGCVVHTNCFGVILKPNQPGKWHLIMDLSHPDGAIINDGVDSTLCSPKYALVDDTVRFIGVAGKGAPTAKLDIQSAYRNVPVNSDDQPLLSGRGRCSWMQRCHLGFSWLQRYSNTLADELAWILEKEGSYPLLHYLDDFLLVGGVGSEECAASLRVTQEVCRQLGVPLVMHKLDGPACCLTFLIDTEAMELRLPADKLAQLGSMIQQWRARKYCSKRELLSLIGHLQHACRVVKPDHVFLQCMIDLASVAKELHQFVRLNKGFRSDLESWALFLHVWN